jgi:hypothetical protein
MGSRFMNIASVLIGCLISFLSVRLLLNHQYVTLRHNVFTEDPKRWEPTVVYLFAGIWLFVFGLVGLIDESRRTKSKSE